MSAWPKWLNFVLLAGAGLLLLYMMLSQPPRVNEQEISYSQFLEELEKNRVKTFDCAGNGLCHGSFADGERYFVYNMEHQAPSELIKKLKQHGVKFGNIPPEAPNTLGQVLIAWLPMLLLIGVWVYFMRQQQMRGPGGMGKTHKKVKSVGTLQTSGEVRTTFADVAGIDEAKAEVLEVVEFLRNPQKFQALGAKIPCGVLLIGPAGTGKTLLAKAIAGEAKASFLSISGSEFVEMFVGVGAARVRDLFQTARSNAPCIIFIDEIDAIGRSRGAGLGGGNDEREQTLNQILVEMDGFEANNSFIVIAATNRPDILDPALIRPGRFDRHVVVSLPDVVGRTQILQVHTKNTPLAEDVKVEIIARGTPGFSGADLANLVNEAAITAARLGHTKVEMSDFEKAKDKNLMGAERRLAMSEEEKLVTAYHEAGHCLVGCNCPSSDPVHKISIIPRGRALGVTFFLPKEDRYSQSREALESRLAILFGGRVAETLVFGEAKTTTGASDDIKKATEIARKMVTEWGFSKLGPQAFEEEQGEVFLGKSISQRKQVSDATAYLIDQEIKNILEKAQKRAEEILQENRSKLEALAKALVELETLDAAGIDKVLGTQARNQE